MSVRKIPVLAFACWLFSVSAYVFAQSQAEYAKEAYGSWVKQIESMEESWNRLVLQAEQEPDKEAARQLKQAKEKWEHFGESFCKSMSKTYGGHWASVHESECRVKLAKQLKDVADSYGW